MNRLIRVILYIAAGCVGIGCAALILSFALGKGQLDWEEDSMFGRAQNRARNIMEGTKNKVQRELVSAEESDEYVYEDDFDGDIGMLAVDASSIQNLSIDLQHGCLTVEESDDNQIRVSMMEAVDGLTVQCESGEIVIKDGRTGNLGREDMDIYLEIPEGTRFQNVNIQINAGIMEADCGFLADNLIVNADAGEISLSEVTSDVFAASVGAGVIGIEDGVFLQTVSLECGVGSMNIEADITGDAQIDCGMGAVELELAKGADSVNYAIHCGAGNIEIGDNSYSGLSKKSRIDNGASAEFTLNCGMGQITIE